MNIVCSNNIWQGRQDLNLRHRVLETRALPTELLPYELLAAPLAGPSGNRARTD